LVNGACIVGSAPPTLPTTPSLPTNPSPPSACFPGFDANCQCYTDAKICKKCFDGYELNDSNKCDLVVVGSPSVNNCLKYGYSDTNGKWFTSWTTGCKKVCIKC
jgi:hypothetical protein